MLGKKFRWSPADFPLRKPKEVISSRAFVLKVYAGEKDHNRFALLIGARVEKKASRRHFWKRRFADRMALWPNCRKDFLVLAHEELRRMDKKQLISELDAVLRKVQRDAYTH